MINNNNSTNNNNYYYCYSLRGSGESRLARPPRIRALRHGSPLGTIITIIIILTNLNSICPLLIIDNNIIDMILTTTISLL